MNKLNIIFFVLTLVLSQAHGEQNNSMRLLFPLEGVQKEYTGSTRGTAPQTTAAYVIAEKKDWFYQWPVPEPIFPYKTYKNHTVVRKNQEPGYYACRPSINLPKGCGRPHMGVDIYAHYGTPIIAPENGTITSYSGQDVFTPAGSESKNGGRGRVIEMLGESGYKYVFVHTMGLSEHIAKASNISKDFGNTEGKISISVPIKAGDVVGFVGRTGGIRNPHLHLEVSKDDVSINPNQLFHASTERSRVR